MTKETFSRHYFDTYLPLFKKLNQSVEQSSHKEVPSLLQLMRNILDSPGEAELFSVAANVSNCGSMIAWLPF